MGQFTVAAHMPVFGQLPVVRCRGTGNTYLCWESEQLSVVGDERVPHGRTGTGFSRGRVTCSWHRRGDGYVLFFLSHTF